MTLSYTFHYNLAKFRVSIARPGSGELNTFHVLVPYTKNLYSYK